MSHLIFIVLHLVALVLFMPALLLTIPLHVIYSAVTSKGVPRTHEQCPWCQEYVHEEASICPHCRKALIPDSERRAAHADEVAKRVAARVAEWRHPTARTVPPPNKK